MGEYASSPFSTSHLIEPMSCSEAGRGKSGRRINHAAPLFPRTFSLTLSIRTRGLTPRLRQSLTHSSGPPLKPTRIGLNSEAMHLCEGRATGQALLDLVTGPVTYGYLYSCQIPHPRPHPRFKE